MKIVAKVVALRLGHFSSQNLERLYSICNFCYSIHPIVAKVVALRLAHFLCLLLYYPPNQVKIVAKVVALRLAHFLLSKPREFILNCTHYCVAKVVALRFVCSSSQNLERLYSVCNLYYSIDPIG